MNAEALLADLASSLSIPGLVWSGLGTAALVVDGTLSLNLERNDEAGEIVAWVPLGAAPVQGREASFARMLEHNLASRGRVCVGLDRTRDELVATRTLAVEHTDALGFQAALVELLDGARALLAPAASVDASTPAPAPWSPPTDDPRTLNWMLRA